MKPAAVDHSATRCRERRLFTNAKIEWMAAIRYAATAANSNDRIGKHHSRTSPKEAQKERQIATKRHKMNWEIKAGILEKSFVIFVPFCGHHLFCALSALRVELRESKRGVGHPRIWVRSSSARFRQEPGSREKH